MSQILVAEDEAMLRAIAVEMLEDAGFSVFQAGDGEEALALLKSNPGIEILVSADDGLCPGAPTGVAARPGDSHPAQAV
jgi:CheY-like chemotaxis protein